MLFLLTEELCLREEDSKYLLMKKAVRKLATVTTESQHLLFVENIATAEYFIKLFSAEEDVANLFYLIKNSFYTTDYSFIKRRVDVKLESGVYYTDEDDVIVYPTSIDEFKSTDRCQKSSILGENAIDVSFFGLVLKWFLKKKSISLNTNFEVLSGGGATTKDVLEINLDANKIVLAIIDSDIKYPDCKIGGTLKDCKKMMKRQSYSFKLHALNVHEIENLLPFSFIDHPGLFNAKVLLKKKRFDLIRFNNPGLLKYFDLKKGIQNNDLFSSAEGYRNYAKECCNCDTSIIDFSAHVEASVKNDNVIFPGLGAKVLRTALNHKNNKDQVDFPLLDFQYQEWHEIGQLMLDFTCARNEENYNS